LFCYLITLAETNTRVMNSRFFYYIRITFGIHPNNLLKLWIKHRRSIIALKIKIMFLKSCLRRGIIPPHLMYIMTTKLQISNYLVNNKVNSLRYKFALKMIKMELSDAYKSLNLMKLKIFRLTREVYKYLPVYILNNFFNSQESSLHRIFTEEKNRINKKIDWLNFKQTKLNYTNTKQIHYYYSCPNNSTQQGNRKISDDYGF